MQNWGRRYCLRRNGKNHHEKANNSEEFKKIDTLLRNSTWRNFLMLLCRNFPLTHDNISYHQRQKSNVWEKKTKNLADHLATGSTLGGLRLHVVCDCGGHSLSTGFQHSNVRFLVISESWLQSLHFRWICFIFHKKTICFYGFGQLNITLIRKLASFNKYMLK